MDRISYVGVISQNIKPGWVSSNYYQPDPSFSGFVYHVYVNWTVSVWDKDKELVRRNKDRSEMEMKSVESSRLKLLD